MLASALSFQTLITEHLPLLQRRAVRLAGSRHDAEDIVQDALIRALRHRDQVRSAATARGWLLSIVSSTFLDQRRRRRVRPAEVHRCADVPAPTCGDEPAWSSLSMADVRAAVDRLPDHLRDAYRMFELEGRDYATIAATLQIPKGTVGSRIARARKLLRDLLETCLPRKPDLRDQARSAPASGCSSARCACVVDGSASESGPVNPSHSLWPGTSP
ncbi:MAG TPA: RNA polymerase sigma factor, partial [Kofleriaceae bacterium]|nr:RNA polymerase sigma factor [Kofleriaceae bacterium]